MAKFDHVISLGYFCSTSLELERVGLRDYSYPFDWLITDLKGILDCVENKFDGFLTQENLLQYEDTPHYYYNQKYKVHFYHDFSAYEPLDKQLTSVQEKYYRRISRFYENIMNPTLFIRYISGKEELEYIENNIEQILSVLKKFNRQSELLLISNDDISSSSLKIFQVTKDENDTVARKFLDKNHRLKEYLESNIYDEIKRAENLSRYNNKKEIGKINRVYLKLTSHLKKPYKHNATFIFQQ